MKLTYLGTTVLLFDDGKDQILFDGFFSRVSLLKAGIGLLKTDEVLVDGIIRDYRMDRLRAVFVSHTHYDHVLDAPYLALRTGADLYGSASAVNVGLGGGMAAEKLHSYDDAMEYTIGGFHIRVIPSLHSKANWYNDDLGQVIDRPLVQPAKKKAYKEGGSFDFIVTAEGKTYVIRPSFNDIPGQLDGIRADVLLLGVGGLSKADPAKQKEFFRETIEKTKPSLVIPLHWDNFFAPLAEKSYAAPALVDDTEKSLHILGQYCAKAGVSCLVQLPMTSSEL